MTHQTHEKLNRFLFYILGRHPYEFGLVPDRDGYVKLKDLLKAVTEEDGWRHVRKKQIEELPYMVPSVKIEIQNGLIRSTEREMLPRPSSPESLPKLLYTCIRRKAYLHALEKGVHPMGALYVILSSGRETALKIGKRKDAKPVLLTVQTGPATESGVMFLQAGEDLFLTKSIPVGSFTGPRVPKEAPKKEKESADAREKAPAGSFFIDMEALSPKEKKRKYKKKREKESWKKDRKQIRRNKGVL